LTVLLWVVLAVLLALAGLSVYMLRCVMRISREQAVLREDSVTTKTTVKATATQVGEFREDQAKLQIALTDVQAAGASVESRLGEVLNQLSSVVTQLVELTTSNSETGRSLDELGAKVRANNEHAEATRVLVESQSPLLAELKAAQDTLGSSISRLEQAEESVAGHFNELTSHLGRIQPAQEQQAKRLKTLGAEVSKLSRRVASAQESVSAFASDVADLKTNQASAITAIARTAAAGDAHTKHLAQVSKELSLVASHQRELSTASKELGRQLLPDFRVTNFLAHVSFEEFFAPPELVVYPEELTSKDRAWLSGLLGSSQFALKVFDSVKTFTERYGEFRPELMEKLSSGAAKIMESSEGARWVVVENGKIIGQGVMRTGPTLAHGAASIFSSVTLAAYILVAWDTKKQLKSMNSVLETLSDEAQWLRQSRLEAIFESLRRVSQAGFALDRGTVLNLIKELHELRAFLRRKVVAESPNIQEPNWWQSVWDTWRGKKDEERRVFFDKYRIELLQAHQIFRLEAFAVSLLNDQRLERAFVQSVKEEAKRLDLMQQAMKQSWLGDKGHRRQEQPPAILAEVSELASLYHRSLSDAQLVVAPSEAINA
jgi:septal ring factor EnvC (AmiA/AmiB activator)